MEKDALIKSNTYLKGSEQRKTLFLRTVISSTAVEGVHLDPEDLEDFDKPIKSVVSAKSSRSRR
jgi:16S rRNA G527 N7-methylase RsmG